MPRSAREIDLDPRTYVGLSFPLRADNNNSFALTKNSLEQSRHNLRNLLLTYPGERPRNTEFGCRLREVCFEPMDERLPQKVSETITQAVNKFLPYITIIDIATLQSEDNAQSVIVTIKYSTTLNPEVNQSLTLDTIEGTEIDGGGGSGGGGGY